ncbi:hypothetical protein [Bdellovibrio svalbardensis]|uniref:Uncharacterized protein n=1 Tax=Bdellovibrio svalbardensis TaxID=2972972 RepID=A0ABT6DN70_9BACT|nr:hypothetical protein [Bdellovibrio svalbardensis]MDG0817276.1 hypothetical protein [Bdellovibrio svalbardensis]
MFFQVPKFLMMFLTALAVNVASANEGGHGGGEAKEAKEGEAGKEEKKEVKSAEDSFSVVQARVQALEAKVHSGQEELEKLIVEKQHTSDSKQVAEIVKQMLGIHKELQKNLKEYDQQRALLKYRYPEKGLTEKREYERIDVKSIEDMETQMSLTTSVNHTLKKVRSQYETAEEAKANAEKRSEGGSGKKSSKPAGASLTEPVILKK